MDQKLQGTHVGRQEPIRHVSFDKPPDKAAS